MNGIESAGRDRERGLPYSRDTTLTGEVSGAPTRAAKMEPERNEAPEDDGMKVEEDRVSLHPLDAEEVLVALLATPKDDEKDAGPDE